MTNQLPEAGAASAEVARQVHEVWMDAARRAGVDIAGFNPDASYEERIGWAMSMGFAIATVLSRFSSKMQHSTTAQVTDSTVYAARIKIYVPPELVNVDEAVTGKKVRRDALVRVRAVLKARLATVLLVFKVSRLFRVGYRGMQFMQEEVVERNLRGISISQGIDTSDKGTWKALMTVHGLADELLLGSIADHVRSGLRNLFQNRWTTGALTLGYEPKVVENARPTNLGKPRTMPAINPAVAKMIVEHYQMIADGMSIKAGWRKWVKDGGAYDPRSTRKHMTYPAYRRMLSNRRYTGLWAFGRKRNAWKNSLDYTVQEIQPDTEVSIFQCDELRIVSDELFFRVQTELAKWAGQPRGPRTRENPQLWDLVTEFFYCPECKVRYYQTGANGRGMRCKNGDLCPCITTVKRKDAVVAICRKLSELLQQDADLVSRVVGRAMDLDAKPDDQLQQQLQDAERKLAVILRRLQDLHELLGTGSQEDRKQYKALIRAAQAERDASKLRVVQLQKAAEAATFTLSPEAAQTSLADLVELLTNAAAGRLGDDVVYRAVWVFRQLVGDRVSVHVQRRAGRKQTVVRGSFVPQLLKTLKRELNDPRVTQERAEPACEVWLREPPKLDLLAELVHDLIDNQRLSNKDVDDELRRRGYVVFKLTAWQAYQRYYQMHGLPVPKRPYNNGQPRRRRGA